jgi:hypothetical protein
MKTFINFKYVFFLTFCFKFSFAQSGIQTVRIDFQNPEGYTRHLALGFISDNTATDGVDYGYDALNIEDLQDDLNWIIDGNRYIIQGVGAFNPNKYYPLGMFLSNAGDVEISLNALENFDNVIDVYIYDIELNSYTNLNTSSLIQTMSVGNYINRYFVTFSNDVHFEISAYYMLSNKEDEINNLKIWHANSTSELFVKGLLDIENAKLKLYSIDGKIIKEETLSANTYALNTSRISNGIYLVRIETPTFTYSTKVCVTN